MKQQANYDGPYRISKAALFSEAALSIEVCAKFYEME